MAHDRTPITDPINAVRERRCLMVDPNWQDMKPWNLNGTDYTTRELLLTFGTLADHAAVERANNWKAIGLHSNPGFYAEAKALVAHLRPVSNWPTVGGA